MNSVRCFCAVCGLSYSYPMSADEFRALLEVAKNPLTEKGELILACDDCQPMKYSKPREDV